jgi:hypothetical protein
MARGGFYMLSRTPNMGLIFPEGSRNGGFLEVEKHSRIAKGIWLYGFEIQELGHTSIV